MAKWSYLELVICPVIGPEDTQMVAKLEKGSTSLAKWSYLELVSCPVIGLELLADTQMVAM